MVDAEIRSWKNKNVIVTGGSGFLGSHLVEQLEARGCDPFVPRSNSYNLKNELDIIRMLTDAGSVDVLINLAANVGGIGYNQAHPYSLFYDNVQMGTQLIDYAIAHGVKKFVQIGTVCAYPKWTRVPFKEECLWDGYPEETNAPYGIAKKVLLVQLQAARAEFGFSGIYLLPTNLYGPRDEFNPSRSHVIPALIAKCIEARDEGLNHIEAWGSGNATRDFLYVEDAAEAIILAAERYDKPQPLNLGSGQEVRINSLLYLIAKLTGFEGEIRWDRSRPDGQPRRALSTIQAQTLLDWTARTGLEEGLQRTIEWYEEKKKEGMLYNEHALMEAA